RCPSCHSRLARSHDHADRLQCDGCAFSVPVRNGIARFTTELSDDVARRTQASFGYEWTHFNDWRQSGVTNFTDYFQGIELQSLKDALVLDAGCGMGRHTRQVAPYARHVVAIDFSAAIDQAARNTHEHRNVECVQADLLKLPFGDDTFDFIYSLGVLHHLQQ